MEQRLSSTWRMTVNEKKFIEDALLKDLRVDGRRPFDYRPLKIEFGRDDGSSEVHLGETHVLAYVTSQLIQPYQDRPNEGSLSIFTEFSPMADPSFEAGRPGESAVELGRVIDRGLRESKAVDMESLAVIAGKYVWALRLDIHILDNCGNLIDAANIAALAALSTFRRPECTIEGEDVQEVIIHPPETREPLPLVIHHLPVAVTFAFFNEGNIMLIDPSFSEEAVTVGRMTATINSNGEICAVQKAGGEGVMSSVIMQCLRIASIKAVDITKQIKNAVESFNSERTLKKVKRHSSVPVLEVDVKDIKMVDDPDKLHISESDASKHKGIYKTGQNVKALIGGASDWDPYSKHSSSQLFNQSLASPSLLRATNEVSETASFQKLEKLEKLEAVEDPSANPDGVISMTVEASSISQKTSTPKSLKDAVKPKNKRKK